MRNEQHENIFDKIPTWVYLAVLVAAGSGIVYQVFTGLSFISANVD